MATLTLRPASTAQQLTLSISLQFKKFLKLLGVKQKNLPKKPLDVLDAIGDKMGIRPTRSSKARVLEILKNFNSAALLMAFEGFKFDNSIANNKPYWDYYQQCESKHRESLQKLRWLQTNNKDSSEIEIAKMEERAALTKAEKAHDALALVATGGLGYETEGFAELLSGELQCLENPLLRF